MGYVQINCDHCLEKAVYHLCSTCSDELDEKLDSLRDTIDVAKSLIERLRLEFLEIENTMKLPVLTTADELRVLATARNSDRIIEEYGFKPNKQLPSGEHQTRPD